MNDFAEVIYHWQKGQNKTQIATSLGISRPTVRKYLKVAQEPGGPGVEMWITSPVINLPTPGPTAIIVSAGTGGISRPRNLCHAEVCGKVERKNAIQRLSVEG